MARDYLTDEDKKFIEENYAKMSIYQMAIRRDIQTESGHKCSLISDYVKLKGLQVPVGESPTQISLKEPDASIEKKIEQIAAAETFIEIEGPVENPYKDLSIDDFANAIKEIGIPVKMPLSEKEKRDLSFLLKQTESTRYTLTYKTYRKKDYKKLFREEFIRSMYGKGEMPQEEVNDFIDIANQLVVQHDFQCRKSELEKLRDDPTTLMGHKMGIEQMIIQFNEKYDASLKRVSEIKKQLGISRQQRLEETRPVGLTVAAIIEVFQNERKKEQLFKLQESKDAKIVEVLKKFNEMEASKALIMGISTEELLEGGL